MRKISLRSTHISMRKICEGILRLWWDYVGGDYWGLVEIWILKLMKFFAKICKKVFK